MEEQDAFAVLLSSQSQLPPSKRRRSDQQDKYVACPVCGTSVPRAFLDSHTENCLSKGPKPLAAGTRSSPEKSQTPRPQLVGASSSAGPADAPLQPALSPRRLQRLPSDEFKAMVSAGWDRALQHLPVDEEPAQQRPQQAVPQRQAPMQSPSTAQLCAAAGVPAAAAAGSGAVNAFAVLQAAQAAQVPMDAEMFLEGRADGSWMCHWRIAGAPWSSSNAVPEPCWSASINANLPRQQQTAQAATPAAGGTSTGSASSGKAVPTGSIKLRLQVSTNIPPGFGGAVDWDNPVLPSNGLLAVAGGQQGDTRQPVAGHLLGSEGQQLQSQPHGVADGIGLAAGSTGGSSSTSRWRGGGTGVFISALQKSVRRGCAASATKIALELLKEPKAAEALARRLSIICLEDGLLHPQLPLVVWTMLALGKGYIVGGHLANALLSITHQMASIGFRDFVPGDPPSVPTAGVYSAPSSWHAVDAALGISSPESVLVKSILLRAAYGGMAGDKAMLLAYAGLWTGRFSGCTLPPPPPPPAAAAAGVQQPLQMHGQQQPSPAQGRLYSQEVQQPACKQSEQQAQKHGLGQPQLGEGQHQQEQEQQQPAEVTPPHTGQSLSQPTTTTQQETQQETPLSASQGEVLRPQWLQQQVQQPQQEQQGPQQQRQQERFEALLSQQQGQDVLQPTQLVSTQDLQWAPVQQQQQQEGPVQHPRLQEEQQEDQPKQQPQQHTGQASPEQPGYGPSSSSSPQQPAHQVSPMPARPGALQSCAPQDRQRSEDIGAAGGPQLCGPQPGSPVRQHPQPGPSPVQIAPMHTSDGGSSCRPAGAATSSWLQYLQQQYMRLSTQDPQRVTLVGPVTREDIPLAAVDFHVAPALTQHLKEQPQLKAAVRGMVATSTAVAARLSGPDGFDGLINSTIWHLRSSINRKAYIQAGYIQHRAAGCTDGQVLSRQLLEAAAVAAVAAWSCAGHAAAPADVSTHLPTGQQQVASASACPSVAAATHTSMQLHAVPLERAQQQRHTAQLPPGTGFSEGALRVLQMEVSSMAAFEAEQRRVRQELMPLWKAGLAALADAWCREFLSRRVY